MILMFLLSIVTILGGIAHATPFMDFVDGGSVAIVFVPAVAMTMGAHGVENTRAVLRGLFENPAPERARELAVVSAAIGNSFLLFGVLGALLGGLHFLFYIGEVGMPDTRSLARGSAIMLLSTFYGLTVKAVLFQPLTARFNRIASEFRP